MEALVIVMYYAVGMVIAVTKAPRLERMGVVNEEWVDLWRELWEDVRTRWVSRGIGA